MKKRTIYLTPGELVVRRFAAAGINASQLASLVGRHSSRIIRLTKPPPEGTGGNVPREIARRLLTIAPKHGVSLTAEELMMGGRG